MNRDRLTSYDRRNGSPRLRRSTAFPLPKQLVESYRRIIKIMENKPAGNAEIQVDKEAIYAAAYPELFAKDIGSDR